MKRFYLVAAALAPICAGLSGCLINGKPADTPHRVRFSTTISNSAGGGVGPGRSAPATRASNNRWDVGDRIGVYMFPADDSRHKMALAENSRYRNDLDTPGATATFLADGEANVIEWPADDIAVDFAAYYPWREDIPADFIYPVDIATQNPQEAIDLLYSDNMTDRTSSDGDPDLDFTHRLVKLVFNVNDAGGSSTEGMKATFRGLPATAGFDLATGRLTVADQSDAAFDAVVVSTADGDEDPDDVPESAVVEAIVLPGDELDYTLTFTLEDGEQAVFEVEDAEYEAGMRYIYNIWLVEPTGGDVSFGVDGDLNSITDWADHEDNTSYEIPKGNGGGDNGSSAPGEDEIDTPGPIFRSGTLVKAPDASLGYSVITADNVTEADGLKLTAQNSRLSIVKDDYSGGVTRVVVAATVKSFSVDGRIAVKAGEAQLVRTAGGAIDKGVSAYVFEAPNGMPVSGDIEIVVEVVSVGIVLVKSFGVNTTIPENNP